MTIYKTVLLATDLSDESIQVAEKAKALTAADGTLHMIHVVEPLSFAYGGDIPMNFSTIQDEIQKQAESQMINLAARYGVPENHQHIAMGRAENEIHALADELKADVVVIGSHGRHGIALLLGSTANGVVHGANCDVLAVRVHDD